MFVECPHCNLRVGIGTDGMCPNCRRDTRDTSGTDPEKSTLIVACKAVMPDVCCSCGLPTTRRTTLASRGARNVERSGSEAPGLFFAALTWLIAPFALIFGNNRSRQTSRVVLKLKLSIPQCDLCSSNAIEPIEVDHERGWMRLLVHNTFRDSYREQNAE